MTKRQSPRRALVHVEVALPRHVYEYLIDAALDEGGIDVSRPLGELVEYVMSREPARPVPLPQAPGVH